ncbi:MAG: TIM barrel protein [Verrucomicrobia bacterium]|nr:TIM barrel protein [Verrucomicrobiota bacterium]
MNLTHHLSRRSALKTAGLLAAVPFIRTARSRAAEHYKVKNSRINQSVVPWCFKPMPPEELIEHSHQLGLPSVELIDPKHWPRLKELGMTCAIAGSHGFSKGFANPEEHDECVKLLTERIEQCAKFGVKRVITFSGFKKNNTDESARKNFIAGLKKILPVAEQHKVVLCPEMLNTKVAVEMKGHPGYWFNDMDVAIGILKEIGSEYCKVLFDIYHVQIMHGDVIARIRQYAPYIGHVHTAGVPGRNEIDDTQEINYPPIMKALLDVKYTGYVGQEFIPLRDKVTSLSEAVKLCDV